MSSPSDTPTEWFERMAAMNRQYADTVRETMTAQGRMMDAWFDAVDDATDQERIDESAEAVLGSYEIWMQAAEDTLEQAADAMEGEEVPPERFRDTWLNAANRAFKNAMDTRAFAAATGQSADDVLEFRRQIDEMTAETLRDVGLPTQADVEEVGERLVELERRQHAVEQRLERILDALEEE